MSGQPTILPKHKFNRDDITIIAMLRCLEIQPSAVEMGEYIGKSASAVRYKLKWLIEQGYLIREGKRAVQVTEKGEEIYPEFVVIVREKGPPLEPVPIG